MDDKANSFFLQLKQAVESDQLLLPTLPEVALRIREAVEEKNCSAKDIADIMANDSALSVQLVRVANSPLYRGREKMEDLRMIVSRLGMRLVKDLVISLAVKQTFAPTTQASDLYFRDAWTKSVGVAAISRMLAPLVPELKAEQALLAGLIHNIGVLPILVMAEKHNVFRDKMSLENIIYLLQGRVGKLVLESWDFPQYLIDVVTQCDEFQRMPSNADYVDLVQVSLIQGNYLNGQGKGLDLGLCTAFKRLNLDPDLNVIELEENQEIIQEIRSVLL